LKLLQVLFSQGMGTRRVCAGLIERGHVRWQGQVLHDPAQELDTQGLTLEVLGREWPYVEHALLMLHKPAGYECSQKPRHHPSVMTLLPEPLRLRGVQPIGRLDEDTTGLLLFTDDGGLIHRWTSPKHHVPKVYEIGTRHPVDEAQLAALRSGVVLDDDPTPVRAAACEATAERTLRMVLTEGKYHQVKRMVAAAGNRVDRLHRSAFGHLSLPADLAPGQWRWASPEQVA
jgi:16S rRNA pseudouridine516 synthase